MSEMQVKFIPAAHPSLSLARQGEKSEETVQIQYGVAIISKGGKIN
jgi:hypothetical protein